MKAWPEKPQPFEDNLPKFSLLQLCNYHEARADAAMERLIVSVDALTEVMNLEQESSTGDTFDVAAEALGVIGTLPPDSRR